MNRPLAIFAAAMALVPASVIAQSEFRSVASGPWTDSRNWEIQNDGIWLQPPEGVFPGESHHRDVDVIVGDNSTVTVGEGQSVEVNSLTIMQGRVEVNGMLIVGPTKDDPGNSVAIISGNGGLGISAASINDAPTPRPSAGNILAGIQFPQNIPNPVSFATGDQTTFTFYIDEDYSLARLSIYDEMGVEIQRIYEDYHPSVGWKSVKINTRNLQSGSYPVILQAGNTVLRRSLTIIR
ncbi:MAG TPA: hypothetical protein VEW28_04975 [Candidatus Kapabacteria bacterium]|nr:hypothetical protein [Candidatus Kapabacteria bacterium]